MHSPFGDGSLSGDLSLAVVRLGRRLRGRRENRVVSLTQLSAMYTLYQEGPMTPGALAAAERVRPPSMTRVIASLADLGMIKREPHPTDGRQAIVALSEPGLAVIKEELEARKAWLSDRLRELTPDERETLREGVRIFNQILAVPDADAPRSRAV
ncbi:MarR family transcriptional regulator [Gordonia paraffinivorans]|uniref:MarR family transcriptional regulator n=1 Tax=Gordonia paraffinivorans TaxID=175628 RepID=UPI0024330E9F|nr:MarR family transcriptional regulator [Gordonia paraffinivorans]